MRFMNRVVTIAVLSASCAAGLAVAVLLALAPSAGAETGTTSTPSVFVPETTTATATPHLPEPRVIAEGVTIGGTVVGGLTAPEAKKIITARFVRPLRLVGGPGARIAVTPRKLGAVPDIAAAVQLAARVKRPGFFVPLKVQVSRTRVERFVTSLGERFRREPVDGTLKLRNLKPFAKKDVAGRRLKELVASRAIVLALKTQSRGPLDLPFALIKPSTTSDTLGHAIVIKRGSKDLYLYKVGTKPKLVRKFKVATGLPEYPTPLGRFEITVKQQNPWWYPPTTSEWAKDLEPVPPGSGNPLGTRWMGISSPYVGIHGTPDSASVGYSASHGCIRMLVPNAEWLFDRIEVGTPVFIVAA